MALLSGPQVSKEKHDNCELDRHLQSNQRLINVDSLRGIAAMLVIWLHVAEVFVVLPDVENRGTVWYDLADLLGVGRMGVIAFFAISGYVIVPTIHGARVEGSLKFLIKRFFRLFPPFWFSICISAVTVWWLFDRQLTLAIFAANLTMVPVEFGEHQMMGHFWTLEVELIFYCCVLLLFWRKALHREQVVAWWLIGIALAWPLLYKTTLGRQIVDRNLVWSYLGYFLSVMFWGAMLRTRHQRTADEVRWKIIRDWPFVVVTALVFGRPIIAILFGSPFVHREDWNGTVLGLLLFLFFLRLPRRLTRPLAWIGTVSYSLYLLHPAIFYPIFYFASQHPNQAKLPLWGFICVSELASILAAVLAYWGIEKPSIAIGRYFIGKFRLC